MAQNSQRVSIYFFLIFDIFYIAQVFANLLQLYQMVTEKNNDPDQNSNRTLILKIFDHIIIDHKKTLARKPNAFAMINFIPEIPEFAKHNQVC